MKKAALTSLLVFSLILLGCGGGSSNGGSSSLKQGSFVDSEVQGVRYETPTQSGVTNAAGTFSYNSGETVSFYVGDILLGQVVGADVITPVELVGAVDETDPTVTNIARFLQTIDDDGDPDNGILITDDVINLASGQAVNFDQSVNDFTNDGSVQTLVTSLTTVTSSGARNLISAAQAQSHLSSTIFNTFAGSWSGSFSGDDSGPWSITISSTGLISGNGSSSEGSFTITGSISTSGSANFATGGVSVGATFSGIFDYSQGTASGTWNNSPYSGSWSGSKD